MPDTNLCTHYASGGIEVKASSVHGMGSFATESIRKGRRVGKYRGVVMDGIQHSIMFSGTKRSLYSLLAWESPSGRLTLTIDSSDDACPKHLQNWTKYINDYRNTGKQPNVQFVGPSASVVTLRDIEAGEELLIDYGEQYWTGMQKQTTTKQEEGSAFQASVLEGGYCLLKSAPSA